MTAPTAATLQKQKQNPINNIECECEMYAANWNVTYSAIATAAHLIYFAIVIVIVSNAVDALDVVPNGAPKFRCVNVRFIGHREIRQIVCGTKFQIQQMANVVVETIDQRKTMIIPGVILHTKRAWHILSTASREILICEQRIFDEMVDIFRNLNDWLFDGVG